MPLQNRVTPFGEIIATPERGLFIGNRGIIHDPATKTLLLKRWAVKMWLLCTRDYKGIRRDVWAKRSWTELFFLDEATAFAAGHRPCFECRRADAERFRAAWMRGNGVAKPTAPEIDDVLHRERLDNRRKRIHPLTAPLEDFPDGAMIAAGDRAYLIVGGRTLLWSPGGYARAAGPSSIAGILTPPSMLAALSAGYRPLLHPSAESPI
jgi:hypothetical protein